MRQFSVTFGSRYFRTKPALSWMRDIAYLKGTYMSGPEKDLFQMYLQELIRGEE